MASAPAPPAQPLPAPLQLPASGLPSQQLCTDLQQALLAASWAGVAATAQVLPADVLQHLVQAVTAITSKEPTLVEVQPSAQQQRVTVVGDTHGQFHDVCRMFELYGPPSADRLYVFNGDFVDRGAWGVEVLALLMAYKWLYPHQVVLVRGNHESSIITQVYGFAAELKAKYGKAAKGLFTHLKRFFGSLPLAALVENATLILHGGLFRAPPAKAKAGGKRRRSTGAKLSVGTLDDLRKASKGGQDPDPDRSVKNLVACDVLWSDPVNDPGIRVNEARGCGTVFGPDVTAEFLAANGLRLIIRSHEGPDARDKRLEGDKMPPVDSGYAEDHVTPSGKLVTLFSAPDYPQFMAEGEERYSNRGAVLHLSAPDYATPQVESFDAVLPRPQVESYYEVPSYTEDEDDEEEEEGEPGSASQCSRGQAGDDTASTATAAAEDADDEDTDAAAAAAGAVQAAAAAAATGDATAAAGVSLPAMLCIAQQHQPPLLVGSSSGGSGHAPHAHAHTHAAATSAGGGWDPRAASCHKPQASEVHAASPQSPRRHVVVPQRPPPAAADPAAAAAVVPEGPQHEEEDKPAHANGSPPRPVKRQKVVAAAVPPPAAEQHHHQQQPQQH